MEYRCFLLILILFTIGSCSKSDDEPVVQPIDGIYFPPLGTDEWETTSASELNWNLDRLEELKEFLVQKNSKSFMILVNGKIVVEEYFNGHSANETWEWNSSGKGLVSATIGVAQQESLIDINNKVSNYLGSGWTNMSLDKENLITVRHLLTMTSGIDDSKQFVTQSNLTYVADAGTRWAYGNVFQKLMNVISEASNSEFSAYFNTKVKNKIGMDGYWNEGLIFTIYHSTTRSMARFGLLTLNKGKWGEQQIVNDDYFNESINSSQNLNTSYGYMWWLNGKSNFMVPGSQEIFQGSLVPNAPIDMYAAMGANDQRIYVIPNKNMVIIRMGEASDPDNSAFAISGFDNVLWEKINAVIN